ncbi:uncharacterized protein PAC_10163 [Phialocephala subalpina]|uniref:Secreted protein n=1 Tax=Phialocephala subalpina TaxID=576137 RepID=A0A1L7X5I0_9HELO|nr:uncharacterized protein PAC_10163 [Phialocephala subalpina]
MKMNVRIAGAILAFVGFVAAAPVPEGEFQIEHTTVTDIATEQPIGDISDTIISYIQHDFAKAMIEHQPKLGKDIKKCGLNASCIKKAMYAFGEKCDEQAISQTVSQLHLIVEDGAAPNVTDFKEKFKPVIDALNDRLKDRAEKCGRNTKSPVCLANVPKALAAQIEKDALELSHGEGFEGVKTA